MSENVVTTVLPNDIKKGWIVKRYDGFTGVVTDNKRGHIRNLDLRDDYVYHWTHARPSRDSDWLIVTVPEKWRDKATLIRSMGFIRRPLSQIVWAK